MSRESGQRSPGRPKGSKAKSPENRDVPPTHVRNPVITARVPYRVKLDFLEEAYSRGYSPNKYLKLMLDEVQNKLGGFSALVELRKKYEAGESSELEVLRKDRDEWKAAYEELLGIAYELSYFMSRYEVNRGGIFGAPPSVENTEFWEMVESKVGIKPYRGQDPGEDVPSFPDEEDV